MKPFLENKPLKEVSTFGIGGPARYYTEVRTIEQMQQTILHCREQSLPYFILGKGSNCLFSDQGFCGLVIHNKIDFIENASPGLYHVGSGYSFSLLGAQTARQGWSGLEFASGIPASVGGAVFMNAGANGKETCESLVSVDYINDKGFLELLPKDKIHFSYRHSSFQKMKGAIVGATFQLSSSTEARQKQLGIIEYRKNTQPLSEKSAGCIFRNPTCGHAGALIEQSGLKGTSVGGAQLSEIHANFIVNTGKASAQDVLALINLIQKHVSDKKGVSLESEVRIIPYESEMP